MLETWFLQFDEKILWVYLVVGSRFSEWVERREGNFCWCPHFPIEFQSWGWKWRWGWGLRWGWGWGWGLRWGWGWGWGLGWKWRWGWGLGWGWGQSYKPADVVGRVLNFQSTASHFSPQNWFFYNHHDNDDDNDDDNDHYDKDDVNDDHDNDDNDVWSPVELRSVWLKSCRDFESILSFTGGSRWSRWWDFGSILWFMGRREVETSTQLHSFLSIITCHYVLKLLKSIIVSKW